MSTETPFQQRFDAAMAHVGASSRSAFGRLLGVADNQKQKLYNWRVRDGRIPDDQRKPLAAIGLSIDWINDGEGEMILGDRVAPVARHETSGDYLRVDQLDAEGSMGQGRINDDYPEVVRSVDFSNSYIRALVGFVPSPGRLKLVTGVGDSMSPKIRPGESVLVDTGCNDFVGNGLYLISTEYGHQIKALHAEPDGIWARSMDPVLYPPFKLIPSATTIGGRVYLIQHLERVA